MYITRGSPQSTDGLVSVGVEVGVGEGVRVGVIVGVNARAGVDVGRSSRLDGPQPISPGRSIKQTSNRIIRWIRLRWVGLRVDMA